MSAEEVNKLFYKVLKVEDNMELLNINLEIESLFHNKELKEDDVIKLQLAVRTKVNELAMRHIISMIAVSSTEKAGLEVETIDKDKMH